jgi:hypothetical protein
VATGFRGGVPDASVALQRLSGLQCFLLQNCVFFGYIVSAPPYKPVPCVSVSCAHFPISRHVRGRVV